MPWGRPHLLHQLSVNHPAVALEQLDCLAAAGQCAGARALFDSHGDGRVDVLGLLGRQHIDGTCTGAVAGQRRIVLQAVARAVLHNEVGAR